MGPSPLIITTFMGVELGSCSMCTALGTPASDKQLPTARDQLSQTGCRGGEQLSRTAVGLRDSWCWFVGVAVWQGFKGCGRNHYKEETTASNYTETGMSGIMVNCFLGLNQILHST